MHHLLSILVISAANNLDNVGVRIAYSIRGIKITNRINLWISVITFVITFFAALSGTWISGILNKEVASVVAMLILVAIGSWMIVQPYVNRVRKLTTDSDLESEAGGLDVLLNPEKADRDHSKNIEFREATLLGIALSLNNVGGGVSAGMMGLNKFWVGFLSAALSYMALWGGNYIADFCVRWNLTNKATIAAGVALIAIGIEQVL